MDIPQINLAARASPSKKLLFLHVAKAGGSSVKSLLARYFAEDQQALWLESDPRWRDPNGLDQLRQMQFLAGHLTYHNCARNLKLEEYVVATCLRNPLEHVVSHIAWIRRLAERKNRQEYAQHPDYIQRLARKLAALDLSSPAQLTQLYAELADLELHFLDNCQTRYFSPVPRGERVQSVHLDHAVRALKKVDVVGDTDNLRAFLAGIAQRMGWPIPRHVPEKNVNSEKYGLDLRDPAIVQALEPFVHYDQMLFSQRSEYSQLVTFPEPVPELPERYTGSEWMEVHCACVDELSSFTADNDGGFIIRGWAVDVKRQAAAEMIWLLLENQDSGRRYFVCLHGENGGRSQLLARPDVAEALKNSSFIQSGFSSLFMAPAETGVYKLSILVMGAATLIQKRQLERRISVDGNGACSIVSTQS